MKSRPIPRQQTATHNHQPKWSGRSLIDKAPVELQLVRSPTRRPFADSRQLQLQQRYPPASWQTIAWVTSVNEAVAIIELLYATTFDVERV